MSRKKFCDANKLDTLTIPEEEVRIVPPILDASGEVIEPAREIHVYKTWDDRAVSIFASKYMIVVNGKRETKVSDAVARVVNCIASSKALEISFGSITEEERQLFSTRLTKILANQLASFNSPVWFNAGLPNPQMSACFILGMEDDITSIIERQATEIRIFKGGSGSGVNNSKLRGSMEQLSDGGYASGPISFMKGFDTFAGVVKSAGKRRAAKIEILDQDHPDIEEFINCKPKEEERARILKANGYGKNKINSDDMNLAFQNANLSVRVNDRFMRGGVMQKVARRDYHSPDKDTYSRMVGGVGDVLGEYMSEDMLRKIAEAAHKCGCPGIIFADTVERWNPLTKPINACNPCSEFTFIDFSACNLSSINLAQFFISEREFDQDLFVNVVEILTISQNAICDISSYPDHRVAENSRIYRPIGIGFTNLHTLLILFGVPYDSTIGRGIASSITFLMTAAAFYTSSWLKSSSFIQYKSKVSEIIANHYSASANVSGSDLIDRGRALINSMKSPPINVYVTNIAPTGTISFGLGCESTGCEPIIKLSYTKRLSGGGDLATLLPSCVKKKIINKFGDNNLLGWDGEDFNPKTEEEKNFLATGIFDCALGHRWSKSISIDGHLKMMAAIQPFISGGISKTVNLPEYATVDDVIKTYKMAHELGLKSVAIYRNGSKAEQPIIVKETKEIEKVAQENKKEEAPKSEVRNGRKLLPDSRNAITHAFRIGGHKGYITVGLYQDGSPGEIFINIAKQGSTVRGLSDALATIISLALQHGVPVSTIADKLINTRFEPYGITRNPNIRIAKSILDYIGKWLEQTFTPEEAENANHVNGNTMIMNEDDLSGSLCPKCMKPTIQMGTCEYCPNCESSTGCS